MPRSPDFPTDYGPLGGRPPLLEPPDPPPQTDSDGVEAGRAQLTNEYVVSGNPYLEGYYQALPQWTDDLTRSQGLDIYAQMLLDDQVKASLHNVVLGVMAEGLTIRPAVDDDKKPGYEEAVEVLEELQADLDALPRSLDDTLHEMLIRALAFGHCNAEQVYRAEDGLTLDRLNVKPRGATAFVVDRYGNLAGLLARLPGQVLPAPGPVLPYGGGDSVEVLPPEKFLTLTWDAPSGDPRGQSGLRSAYRAWWEKLQLGAEYVKNLTQFGSPSLVGELPPRSQQAAAADAYGNPTGDAASPVRAQQFLNSLVRFRNGQALVHPNGGKVYLLNVPDAGASFLKALERLDRRIDKAITGQVLAGQEARMGTRAQAQVHQDVLGTGLRLPKLLVCRMLTRGLFRPMVEYRHGAAKAEALCPKASLQAVEHQDKAPLLTAYSTAWQTGLLRGSQRAAALEELGLPSDGPGDEPPPLDAAGQNPGNPANSAPASGEAPGVRPAVAAQPAQPSAAMAAEFADAVEKLGRRQRRALRRVLRGQKPPAAPNVTVHPAAAPSVTVNPPAVTVNLPEMKPVHNIQVPEQPPPTVNVENHHHAPEQAPPVVHVEGPVVNVPELKTPEVHVHAAEQPAPVVNVEAPVVNVAPPAVEVKVDAAPTPKVLRVERDRQGRIVGGTVTPEPEGK